MNESYILFTTVWQLKLLTRIKYFFIDATFKTTVRTYYQTLKIISFIEDVYTPIPLIIIPMTNKSYESYNNLFIVIKSLI